MSDSQNSLIKNLARPRITQVFCSAFPFGQYLDKSFDDEAMTDEQTKAYFENYTLAKMCIDATYEATFLVAILRAHELQKRVRLFLTNVGAG
eukprot:325122-Rhodomonas_salina.1